MCVAACCSVLQRVAACCSDSSNQSNTLQHAATRCNIATLQKIVGRSVKRVCHEDVAACCSGLQYIAVFRRVLQCVAVCRSVLQCVVLIAALIDYLEHSAESSGWPQVPILQHN